MNCKDRIDLISRYLDGEITPAQASRLQEHLLLCPDCRRELEDQQQLTQVLETEPADSFNIDLTESFRKKLETASRRKSFSFPMISRKWATACALVVLLICAGAVGSYIGRSNTLYISNPRDYSSSVSSSMAIAADLTQNQPAIDPLLVKDSRLDAIIDVQARGETLKRIMETLSAKTGVGISVSPELESQILYLKLPDLPTHTVLSEIAALTSSNWVSAPGKSGTGYKLICPESVRKMAAAVADAQAIYEAVGQLQKLSGAIQFEDLSSLQDDQLSHLAESVIKFKHWKPYEQAYLTDSNFLALVDEEVIATLASGGVYERTYEELLDKHNTDWMRSFRRSMKIRPDAKLRLSLSRDEDGGVMFTSEIIADGFHDTFGRGLWTLSYGSGSTNLVTDQNLDTFWREAVAKNGAYAEPWLQAHLGNSYTSKTRASKNGIYTIMQLLDLLAERTNQRISADCYTLQSNYNLMLPRELTVGELLALLDNRFGYAWSLSPNGVLRLVHRQWPMLRNSEPPAELVESVNQTISRSSRPTIEQMAELGKLNKLQLDGALAALEDRDCANMLGSALSNGFNETLRFYCELSPAKRRLAESRTGLASSGMTKEERVAARTAAYMLSHNNIVGHNPEQPGEPFSLSVQKVRCTGSELEEITGCKHFSGGGVYTETGRKLAYAYGTQDWNKPHDFLIFKYIGEDISGGPTKDVYGVIAWPNP